MKKSVITIIFALIGLVLVLPACEKEDSMLLSEYVIGEWFSQELTMDQVDVTYFIQIDDNTYSLRIYEADDPSSFVDLDPAVYTVDDENNVITIDEPDFPGEESSTGTVSFNVIWNEDTETMTWEPVEDGPHGPPTIIWTSNTGE